MTVPSDAAYEDEIQASARRCLALLRASLLQHELIRDKQGIANIKSRIARYEAILEETKEQS